MTSPHRRPAFEIFSMLFGIVYMTCFYMDWAPFRYYPDTRRFHLQMTPQDGPAILWYGWLAAAAGVSAAIAAAVPRRLAERLWPGWAWAVPVLVAVLVLVYERRWFV
ncbi:MAG: hypothetical protein ABI868_08960 [Acidobacteriota bacterium]